MTKETFSEKIVKIKIRRARQEIYRNCVRWAKKSRNPLNIERVEKNTSSAFSFLEGAGVVLFMR